MRDILHDKTSNARIRARTGQRVAAAEGSGTSRDTKRERLYAVVGIDTATARSVVSITLAIPPRGTTFRETPCHHAFHFHEPAPPGWPPSPPSSPQDSPPPRRAPRAAPGATTHHASWPAPLTATPPQLVMVQAPTVADRNEVIALGLDMTEHGDASGVEVVLHGTKDAARLREAGFGLLGVKIADLAAREQANAAKDREGYDAAVAQSPLPSGRTSYRTLDDYNNELTQLAQRYRNLVKPLTLHNKGRSRAGRFGASRSPPTRQGQRRQAGVPGGRPPPREWLRRSTRSRSPTTCSRTTAPRRRTRRCAPRTG